MQLSGRLSYLDPDEFDDLAEYYEAYEDIEMAVQVVQSGLLMHPLNESLLIKQGKYLVCEAKYDEALTFFTDHFSYYNYEVHLLRIESLLQLGYYSDTLQLVQDILSDPNVDMGEALSELGFVYLGADYFNEAILYLKKSLDFVSTDRADILNDLAYSYEMKGDFDGAIESMNMLLDESPYSFNAWVNLGKLYSIKEQFDKAIDAFDFALTIDEDDDAVIRLKAHCLLLVGRAHDAVKVFAQNLERFPDDIYTYVSLAECYLSMDDYDSLLSVVSEGERIDPYNVALLAKKAIALLYKGEVDWAFEVVKQGLKIDEFSLELNSLAADISFSKDEYIDAQKYINRVLEDDSENLKALEKLGTIHIVNSDYEQAILCFERIVALSEPSSVVQRKLALLYFEVGDREQFIASLNNLADQDLYAIYELFYDNLSLVNKDREAVILSLINARECRDLFKNIKY